ncbi:MAG TPA: hypothetical protein VFK02_04140, partial [Kofleriaceae bacterium]|nr:hypothetical protein [Kofleriaceae bacterium]
MVPVLFETHGLGCAGLDLCGSALDLVVPGSRRIDVSFAIQAPDQLERQLRPLVGGKPEDLGQYVGRSHVSRVADSVEGRQLRSRLVEVRSRSHHSPW